MTDVPAPFTPPDCDLRGLPFMPLDVVRLVDSDLVALADGEAFKAAVILWCKSWLQLPAASLPDDDRVLAHLTGTGARWRKLKPMALHGFVKCSDGRLYHPVIAEKAREAWKHRLLQRDRANRRWNKPDDGNAAARPDGDATATLAAHAAASATAMQGTGRGRATKKSPERPTSCGGAATADDDSDNDGFPDDLMGITDRCCDAAAFRPVTPAAHIASLDEVKTWIAGGFDVDLDILPTIRRITAASDDPTSTLRRFTRAIRLAHAKRRDGGGVQPARKPDGPLPFKKPGEPPEAAAIRERLSHRIEPATYGQWIDRLDLHIDGRTLSVFADRPFDAEHVANNFGTHVRAAARVVLGPDADVRFKVRPQRR